MTPGAHSVELGSDDRASTPRVGRITKLKLRNFRSVRNASFSLNDLTIFVGPNASGKSNLLDALRFLCEGMSPPFTGALENRGGFASIRHRGMSSGPIEIAVSLELPDPLNSLHWWQCSYAFTLESPGRHDFRVSEESCTITGSTTVTGEARVSFVRHGETITGRGGDLPSRAPDPRSLALPIVTGTPAFAMVYEALRNIAVYDFDVEKMHQVHDRNEVGIYPRLLGDGRNAGEILLRLADGAPRDFRRLNQFLSAAVPQLADFHADVIGRSSVIIAARHAKQPNTVFEARDLSDGTLRLLGLLLAVFQPMPGSLMAFEEPETSLHPAAMGVIWDALDTARSRSQVLVTTHSPDVLDSKDIRPEWLRTVRWHRGATTVSALSEPAAVSVARHELTVGELLRAGALDLAGG
jgi:predicted ATPase